MEKYIYDEKTDYATSWSAITIFPVWRLQERLRLAFGAIGANILLEHNKALYAAMLLSGELDTHLDAIE